MNEIYLKFLERYGNLIVVFVLIYIILNFVGMTRVQFINMYLNFLIKSNLSKEIAHG